jgi:hypothetical protein
VVLSSSNDKIVSNISQKIISVLYQISILVTSSIIIFIRVKRSHHVRREGLEIPTLIQKIEEYTPLDFMKI